MELLLGAGTNLAKKLWHEGRQEWSGRVTLDFDAALKPDVVWDLNKIPLPFDDNSADEIHAYDVLEHVGVQGDWKFFFDQFADFWRILRPGGELFMTLPDYRSAWAFGDPGHTRVISQPSLTFLNRRCYGQVGTTAMTDYRTYYKADFEFAHVEVKNELLHAVLAAIKPGRD